MVTKKRPETATSSTEAAQPLAQADKVRLEPAVLEPTGKSTPARTGKPAGKSAGKAAIGAANAAKATRKTATSAKAATKAADATTRGKSNSSDDDDEPDAAADGELDDGDQGAAQADVPHDAEILDADGDEPRDPQDDEHIDESEFEEPPVSQSSPQSLAKLDAMAIYLREIQRHRLLTPEETRELAIRFRETEDPAAAAKLVTANLRLVVKIAYEYRRAYKNIMDLVQEGNIGLMQAVKRYDPYRGVKLSSYGAWWIRAYILRFILNNWRLVKLGTTQAQRKLFFNLRKTRAELQSRGIDPSDAEVAKRLNVSETEVSEMEVRLSSGEKSLDAPVGDSDGRSIAKVDMIPSLALGPEALVADGELQSILKQKLDEFRATIEGRDKDMAIFDLRLIADDPLTLQELGERFGISRERVRQLEQRLTMRLRDYLKRELGDTADAN